MTVHRGGRPRIPDETLLDELRRVSEQLGKVPTAVQMDKHGDYPVTTYRNHFGRWSVAIRAAGLEARR